MISRSIRGEGNMTFNRTLSFVIVLAFIAPCLAAPKHRHRRHLHPLQMRHKTAILNANPKPIEFSGTLKDMNSLNDAEKSKLLNGLQKYIIKHAPELILGKRPSISKVGTVDDNAEVNISIQSNNLKASSAEREDLNSSLQLTKYAQQKVEMALTPQIAILKRKMAKTMRDKSA